MGTNGAPPPPSTVPLCECLKPAIQRTVTKAGTGRKKKKKEKKKKKKKKKEKTYFVSEKVRRMENRFGDAQNLWPVQNVDAHSSNGLKTKNQIYSQKFKNPTCNFSQVWRRTR
jgi:hypothetical protein